MAAPDPLRCVHPHIPLDRSLLVMQHARTVATSALLAELFSTGGGRSVPRGSSVMQCGCVPSVSPTLQQAVPGATTDSLARRDAAPCSFSPRHSAPDDHPRSRLSSQTGTSALASIPSARWVLFSFSRVLAGLCVASLLTRRGLTRHVDSTSIFYLISLSLSLSLSGFCGFSGSLWWAEGRLSPE